MKTLRRSSYLIFRFSITKRSDLNRSQFWLLVDQERYAYSSLYTDSHSTPSDSTTINIQLTAGQLVRVENDYSSLVYGTNSEGYILSWFTGFMLYAL